MKSINIKSFLLPVFASALIFCVSSRACGQSGPCLADTGTNIIINYEEYTEADTFIAFPNNGTSNIIVNGSFKWLSGDSDIFSIEFPNLPFTLPPGEAYQL